MDPIQDPLQFFQISLDEDEVEKTTEKSHNNPLEDENGNAESQVYDPLRSAPSPVTLPDSKTPPPSISSDPLADSITLENVDLGQSSSETIDFGAAMMAAGTALDEEHIVALSPGRIDPGSLSSTRPSPYIRISVSDPVKIVSDHSFIPGLTSSHYEYLITSSPLMPDVDKDWPSGRIEVRRRFNDFVALSELLMERKRGFFIFPRPDKGALEGAAAGRTEIEFIESRRVDLERYLRRLAQHPVIGKSEELRVFLTAQGALSSSFQWQQLVPLRGSLVEGMARLPRQLLGADSTVPTTVDASKNPRYTNDLLRRLKVLGESMRQEYTQPSPQQLPEDEVALRTTKVEVEKYAEVLMHASRKAEKLLREFEKFGVAMGDFGLALVRLSKYEGEESTYTDIGTSARRIATEARRLGMCAVRASRICRSATAESVSALEPLHTELALAPAVIDALRERETALLTVTSIRDDIVKKSAALSIAEESADKAHKAESLKNEIASLEAACDAAEAEYERVKDRNKSELERWRDDRRSEIIRMSNAYGNVARLYNERVSEVWGGGGGGGGGEIRDH